MKKGTITAIAIAAVLIVSGIALCIVSMGMGAQPKELFSNGTFSLDLDDFEIEVSKNGLGVRADKNNEVNISTWPVENGAASVSVEKININWISGNVKIIGADVSEVSFSESADGGINADDALQYRVENGELIIDYCKDGFYFGIGDYIPEKELVLTVPVQFGSIAVDSVSSDIEISGVELSRSLKVNSTSGELTVQNVSTESLECDSISGKIYFEGTCHGFEADTTSGNIEAVFTSLPKEFEADTVSGSVYLTMPAGASFELEFDTVSGRMDSDFELRVHDDEYIAGSGGAEINVSTTSGDCIIRKK